VKSVALGVSLTKKLYLVEVRLWTKC